MAAVWGSRFSTADPPSRAPQRVGAMVAIGLHVVAVAVLLSYEPTRSALIDAAPIMIDFIAPPKPEEPKIEPPIELPRPKPVKKIPLPVEVPPIVTAPAEAPSPIIAPAPPPPPPPEPVAAAPEPLPITPPIFRADYLENPSPPYPLLSRRMGEKGGVLLRVLVNPAGTAGEVQIHTSSGYSRLDDCARDTVRRWKFVPAKRGAEPVAAWVLIPINFKLEG